MPDEKTAPSPVERPRHVEPFLRELGEGVERFRTSVFPKRRALFDRLAKAQRPKALFITCADSRIVPSLITHTGPGDLFIERNPGSLVPIYGPESVGVSASIEYAVAALGVDHVVVCGHSDCGAVKGILHPEEIEDLPAVGRWLGYGAPALGRIAGRLAGASEGERLAALTEEVVLVQLENLRTHPSVNRAIAERRLTLDGWVYRIDTGEVRAYDPARGRFVLWPEPVSAPARPGAFGI